MFRSLSSLSRFLRPIKVFFPQGFGLESDMAFTSWKCSQDMRHLRLITGSGEEILI